MRQSCRKPPPPRAMAGFVAMDLQSKCVLYGGEDSQPVPTLSDTWTWDGTNWANEPVGSGVYFYLLEAGARTHVGKMVLMK